MGKGTGKAGFVMVDGFAFDSVNYRATKDRGDLFAGVPHGIGDFIRGQIEYSWPDGASR